MKLVPEIEVELENLSSSKYRESEKVLAEDKQLKQMRKLFARARNLDSNATFDFLRVVSDAAPFSSKIYKLARSLHSLAKND